MVYLLILVILLIYVTKHDIKGIKKNTIFDYYVSMAFLVMLAGLRYRMAPDSVTFEYEFNNIYPNLYDLKLQDIAYSRYPFGWCIINIIFFTVSNYFVFQLFCALFSNFLLFKAVKKLSKRPFVVILLYYILSFCYLNMDVMREFFAVSLEFYSLASYLEGKKRKAIFIGLLGPSIHTFSIVFFFVILVIIVKPSIKKTLIFAFLIFVLSLSFQTFADIIIKYLPGVGMSLLYYALMDVDKITILGYMTKVFVPIVLVCILFKAKKEKTKLLKTPQLTNEESQYYIIIIIVSYTILVLLRWSMPYVERLFNYYLLLIYILYAEGFFLIVKRRNSFRTLITLMLFLLLFSITNIKELCTQSEAGIANIYRYIPYNSIFEQDYCYEREQIIESEQRVYYN